MSIPDAKRLHTRSNIFVYFYHECFSENVFL